jgi:opacity protein-like surface antigen
MQRVANGLLWSCAVLAALGLSAPARADPPVTPLFGISELKLGALDHDTPGLWSGFNSERRAVDANIEVLFAPWARTFGGYLRPAIGATINFNGDTSKAYADLRWETQTPSGIFFALGMGAAVHNGELSLTEDDRKALGSHVLFHPSAEIGWRFDGVNSISIFADHISNGFTRRYNEGMDTVGLRFGHRFGPLEAPSQLDVPAANFAGAYVGGFVGYQRLSANWYAAQTVDDATGAFAGGGFAGYSWQSGKGVFGLEIDATPAKQSSNTICAGPSIQCSMDVGGYYSFRPRFGWVIDRAMIYGTGGVVFGPWEASATNLATGRLLDSASGTNFGVAIGAGLEYLLLPNLSVRGEIMHYGMAGWDLANPAIGVVPNQFETIVGRVGVSWYFH